MEAGDVKAELDIRNDKIWKILVSLGVPLIVVNLSTIASTALLNQIYTEQIGNQYFMVNGYLTIFVNTCTQLIGALSSAIWIKSASAYTRTKEKGCITVNAFYTMLCGIGIFAAVCIAFADPLLHFLQIPADVYEMVRKYFFLYTAGLFLVGIGDLARAFNNGLGSITDACIGNLISAVTTVAAAILLLVLFRMGLYGGAFVTAVGNLMLFACCIMLLRKRGVCPQKKQWKFRQKLVLGNLKYGSLMIFQVLLCIIGSFAASVQTNRCCSADFISVMSVNLPITAPMNCVTTLSIVFIPQNYQKGSGERVRKFLKIIGIMTVSYGICCALFYIFSGKWYFSGIFTDPKLIEMGQQFWFCRGFGFIFVAFIYVFRYFLDSIGLGKVALLSGIGELLGRLICAGYLIPKYGNIGAALVDTVGWLMGAVFLVSAYLVCRKKIYSAISE